MACLSLVNNDIWIFVANYKRYYFVVRLYVFVPEIKLKTIFAIDLLIKQPIKLGK